VKRVLVIGSGGAGKSTFARRLGQILSLEVIHLDRMYWKPGWTEPSKDAWLATVDQLLARDTWIMDGNYSGTIERRVEFCDTVVFLDLPRGTCIWRVIRRTITHLGTARSDMAQGCPERLTLQFLSWIWNYPKRTRPKILTLLKKHQHRKTTLHLHSPGEVEGFLAHLQVAEQRAAGDAKNARA
jgi:adenylate kinase family enzyme